MVLVGLDWRRRLRGGVVEVLNFSNRVCGISCELIRPRNTMCVRAVRLYTEVYTINILKLQVLYKNIIQDNSKKKTNVHLQMFPKNASHFRKNIQPWMMMVVKRSRQNEMIFFLKYDLSFA